MKKRLNVALVGATGLIGRKFLTTLENSSLPIGNLKLFASEKSLGKKIFAFGKENMVFSLDDGCFLGASYF